MHWAAGAMAQVRCGVRRMPLSEERLRVHLKAALITLLMCWITGSGMRKGETAFMLGKSPSFNMNIPTNDPPLVTDIHWAREWYEIGKEVIKERK